MATKNVAGPGASSSLKKKRFIYSTEAAAISIGIHLLVAVFAGSWVAIKYIERQDALIAGQNIKRPVLERRKLQMPVKAQNLQKKSSRPKVTTRMASSAQSSFVLPDMTGLGGDIGGFDRDANLGDRDLSGMGSAGSLGFGTSGVNFFGAKSKGEKLVFILGTDAQMLTDDNGGFNTYKFAKDYLSNILAGLRSATLFNVMAFNASGETVMFSDKLIAATPENKEAAKKWIEPINKDTEVVGKLSEMKTLYKAPRKYEGSTIVAQQFVPAIQASMEQRADNIFVLCGSYGAHHVPAEEVMKRYKIKSVDDWLTEQGWNPEKRAQNVKDQEALIAKANKTLEDENKAREAKGQPKKFITDIWIYIYNDLKLSLDRPPTLVDRFMPLGYPVDEVLDHLDKVYRFNYVPKKLSKPAVHFVKLISSDGSPVEWPRSEKENTYFNWLKQIPKEYKGRFELLRGAKTVEDIMKNNNFDK